MKKAILFFSILLLIVTLQGCGVPNIFDKTKVRGRLINIVTQEPIPNAKVIIWESKFAIAGPGNAKRIKETLTDADGRFSFTFAAEVNATTAYECWFDDHDKIDLYGDARVELEKHKLNEIVLSVAPAVKFRLKVNPTNCNPGDIFKLHRNSQFGSISDTLVLNNCAAYDDLSFLKFPMGEYYFWWEVRRGAVATEFRDTIYLEAGEERLYEVRY